MKRESMLSTAITTAVFVVPAGAASSAQDR
jgi:hypothetical protein